MRGKDLFEKITYIDDQLIMVTLRRRKKRRSIYITSLSIAACLIIFMLSTNLYNHMQKPIDSNLPMITLNSEFGDSMGFEGYLAYSIDDLVNANPWNENTNLTHLPVINNEVIYNSQQANQPANYTLMETLLRDTAESLGMDIHNLSVTNDTPSQEEQDIITKKFDGDVPEGYFNISKLFMEDDTYQIEIDTSYTTTIEFKSPIKLPDEYNFTWNATYDEAYKVAEYLKVEHNNLMGFKDPAINISGGDFNIHKEQSYHISFFENSLNETEAILNYKFNTINFYCNDSGELDLVRKYYTNLGDVIGNYPIINIDEATDLLKKGNYITTVPYEFNSTNSIKKVELVYRNSRYEKVFIPYYRFYVELYDEYELLDNGLNTYGAYYVPAIRSEYIENMPLWNGDFN